MDHPLRQFRKALGLSLRGLADETGASKSKLFRIEARLQDADLDLLRQLDSLAKRRKREINLDDFLAARPRRAQGEGVTA